MEINSLSTETDKKDENISSTIFIPYYGPIVVMKMTKNEQLLFCGTKNGNIIIFIVNGPNLKKNKVLYDHNEEITSISINETLNMFASSSIDGYIHLYILPTFSLVRSIQISKIKEFDIKNNNNNTHSQEKELLYAEHIFLASNPLPCLVLYISIKRLFKIYSINGEYISQVSEEENSGNLKCPLIFQNLNFHEFLIYGTENGFVKIRSFPDMNLISFIKPFEGQEIKTLELSPDKRFCYVWSHKDKIAVIEDSNTRTGFEMKENNKEKEEIEGEKKT